MKRTILVAAGVALVLILGFVGYSSRQQDTLAGIQTRVTKLEAENRTLATRTSALQEENEELREHLTERGIEAPAPREKAPRANEGARLDAVRQLAAVQNKLAAVTSTLRETQSRAGELENSVERLTGESKRLSSEAANLREELDNAKRVVQATEAELKTKSERLSALETQLKKSREEQGTASQRVTQVSAALTELADINRRRENTVTNLYRRYRDVNDQLRGLAMRLDSQRDNLTGAAPDISRLQTAVNSAEDDLRQLTSLNAQAQRAVQKLPVK